MGNFANAITTGQWGPTPGVSTPSTPTLASPPGLYGDPNSPSYSDQIAQRNRLIQSYRNGLVSTIKSQARSNPLGNQTFSSNSPVGTNQAATVTVSAPITTTPATVVQVGSKTVPATPAVSVLNPSVPSSAPVNVKTVPVSNASAGIMYSPGVVSPINGKVIKAQ